jgi:hypothetical protein
MSVFNSISAPVIIVLLLAGLVTGLSASNTDILNPHTSSAEAQRMNMETTHQQAIYQLQERLSAAKTEAEISEIQRQQTLLDAQYQYEMQKLNQDLAHRELAFKTLMIILTLLAGAFAVALSFGSTIWIGSRAVAYVRLVSPKEKPMIKAVPRIAKSIPHVAERAPYDALDRNQILYNRRINERLQELISDQKGIDDTQVLAARVKAVADPSKMSSQEYRKHPQAH